MADKQITELPANSGVTNETLFPAYQPGAVEPAQKVTGAQFRAFAEAAGKQAAGSLARGGTFIPQFNDATGYLSWTNDAGLPNPDPVQLEGVSSVNGKTGAVKLSAADVGAVNIAGDTMKGTLSIRPNGVNAYSQIYKNATSNESDWGTLLIDRDATNAMYGLKLRAVAKQARITDGVNEVDILHTGNKPSGSYTGNGDATQRTIATGGIGNVAALWNGNDMALLTPAGAIVSRGGVLTYSGEGYVSNGTIYINSVNAPFNASGSETYYSLL